MIRFKSCPRCKGDMIINPEEKQNECLQCGFVAYYVKALPYRKLLREPEQKPRKERKKYFSESVDK